MLKSHGLSGFALHTVCTSIFISSVTYASQSWWGFASADAKQRLCSLIRKARKWGLDGGKPLTELNERCSVLDQNLFKDILANENHVLHQLLPSIKTTPYNLRDQKHNRELPFCTTLTAKNFIPRMLYLK